MLEDTIEKIAFFKEYCGQYIAYNGEGSWDKHKEQYDDSISRVIKGLELFGRFFVRKSNMPDYDLINLDTSIAKSILPKIKAYRQMFLKRNKNLDVHNYAPHASPQEEMSDEEKELAAAINDTEKDWSDGVKAWIAAAKDEEKGCLMNIDEIIYAMRWCLEVDMLNETSEKIAFFKEYYGQYISPCG
jgi:hypothetical protein